MSLEAELHERPRIRGQLGFHTQAAVGERGFKLLVGHLVESPVERRPFSRLLRLWGCRPERGCSFALLQLLGQPFVGRQFLVAAATRRWGLGGLAGQLLQPVSLALELTKRDLSA